MSQHSSVVVGAYCGMLSAVGYTAANICLRAVTHVDPVWVSCIKAIPTIVLIGPWLLVRMNRGQSVIPSLRLLGIALVAAIVGQLCGNVAFQWGLGVVGIAVTVPLTLGTMITGGALLGWLLLGETVTRRSMVAMGVLILAICMLSLGAAEVGVSTAGAAQPHSPWMLALGVGAGCLAGLAYAFLSVAIRHTSGAGMPLSSILVVTTGIGAVSLGALSAARLGWDGMAATPPRDLTVMFAAGICNALAFLALVKALHVTSVVFVNVLNASQAAMAAVAGIVLFGEQLTAPLFVGILLTAAGMLLVRGRKPRPTEEPAASPTPSMALEIPSPPESCELTTGSAD